MSNREVVRGSGTAKNSAQKSITGGRGVVFDLVLVDSGLGHEYME